MGKPKRSRMQNTLLNLFSGFLGEILVYGLSFATRTVFIYTLGRRYLGIGGLFANILSMLSLAEMGFGVALNYRLYQPLKENNHARLCALMSFYKQMYRVIGCVVLLLGLCLVPFLGILIKDYDTFAEIGLNAAAVFVLHLLQSVSTYWFFAYKSAIVKADQKEYVLNIAAYAFVIFTNAVQIYILVALRSYMIYISAVILINILQGYVNARIADHYFPFLKNKSKAALSAEEKKDVFQDCLSISLFSLSSVIVKATDNIVLSAFVGLDIVGLYSNYLMVYNAIKKIIKKVIRSAQASLGSVFAGAEAAVRYEYFQMMNAVMVVLCGTASVCIAVLSDEFIHAWIGEQYIIPMPFSLLIGLELYTIGCKLILEQARDVLGIFQKMKWRPVLEVILNIAISVLLVRKYGIYGVLIGTLVSEWLTVFVVDPVMLYRHGFHGAYSVRTYYRDNLVFLGQLILIGMLNYKLNGCIDTGYAWLTWGLHAVLCGTSTLLLIIVLNARKKAFRMILRRAMRILEKRRIR